MPPFNRKRKNFRAKRAKPRRAARKPSLALIKTIQKIIHRDVETKSVCAVQSSTNFNSGINSIGDVLPLIAGMANGTTDSNRIGDQVRGQNLRVRGHFITRFTGGGGTTYYQNCRIGVRVMIVQPKSFLSLGSIQGNAAVWMSSLLKRGAVTTGFTGIISDLYSDINTDCVTKYYDKVYYIQNPYSNAVLGSPSSSLLMPTGTTKFFNKTIKLKNKLLKYDSGIDSGLTPTNYNPVMVLGYAYLDGTSPDVVTTQIAMSFDAYLDYEDA